MDFTGIIAEYDPFHNGHAAQIAAVRAAGAQCIAVCMSSGAVQRGGVPDSARAGAGAGSAGCRGGYRHCPARALRLRHGGAVRRRGSVSAGRPRV